MSADLFYTFDETTWPLEIIEYLDRKSNVLRDWEDSSTPYRDAFSRAEAYDSTIYGLTDILKKFSLHGYHCTRLTDDEIAQIFSAGMSLQNLDKLKQRINALKDSRIISPEIGERLKNENQADDRNRAGMLWFCFFAPNLVDESGIERFFRSWGGEALYNSHENDDETGRALSQIGTPCVIEAKVPIDGLRVDSLSIHMAKRYSFNRGLGSENPKMFEGYSKLPICSQNILAIHKFPKPEFIRLTQCDTWRLPL